MLVADIRQFLVESLQDLLIPTKYMIDIIQASMTTRACRQYWCRLGLNLYKWHTNNKKSIYTYTDCTNTVYCLYQTSALAQIDGATLSLHKKQYLFRDSIITFQNKKGPMLRKPDRQLSLRLQERKAFHWPETAWGEPEGGDGDEE